MSPSLLPALAANNTWFAIWPEISLGCLALLLLVLEIILPFSARRHIPTVAILGLGQMAFADGHAVERAFRKLGR